MSDSPTQLSIDEQAEVLRAAVAGVTFLMDISDSGFDLCVEALRKLAKHLHSEAPHRGFYFVTEGRYVSPTRFVERFLAEIDYSQEVDDDGFHPRTTNRAKWAIDPDPDFPPSSQEDR